MRKALYTIPKKVMFEFCVSMIHHGLTGEITEITDQDEFILEVSFERSDNQSVNELEGRLAALTGNLVPYEEEEEEEEKED